MKEAVIVTAVRTPVGKAPRGTLRTTRPDDLAALVIRAAVERTPGLEPSQIEDVIMGCAMPEAQQGMNVARIASLRAGLGYQVPAQTVNRFCSSGLQAIALAGQQIMSGMGSTIIAGGTESMSMVPMSGNDFAPNPWLAENYPAVYVSMGMTAENVAREFKINRDDQDAFALRSHQRALAAQAANRFAEELVPVEVEQVVVGPSGPQQSTRIFSVDEGPRKDTSAEALASLAHTLGADAIFASLVCTAQKLAALGSDDGLVEWRNAAACSRGHLRPDGYGLYRHAGQLYGFFLEYDRGTMSARDYLAKFAAYDEYRASGRFHRDYHGFPTILVVTSDNAAEERIARAVRAAAVGRGPALPLLLTCEWRLADPRNPYGLLGRVWREPDSLARRYWPMDSWMTSVSSRARPLSTAASAQRSSDARTGHSGGGGNQ